MFPGPLVNRTRHPPKPGPLVGPALGTTARVFPGRASGQGPFCLPRSRSFRVCWSTGLAIGQNRDRLASELWAPRRGFFRVGRPARALFVYQGLDLSASVGQQDSPSAKTGTACRAGFGHHGAGFSGSGVRPGPFLSTKVSVLPDPAFGPRSAFSAAPDCKRPRRPRVGGTTIGNYNRPFSHGSRIGRRVPADPVSVGR
jgi:hypothetical protein